MREPKMRKYKPTGYVARCQCGSSIGALDFTRSPSQQTGELISQWFHKGCTIWPRFESSWSEAIEPCKCPEEFTKA